MNTLLENNIVVVIVFLLFIIFLLMASMIFILFRLLVRNKKKEGKEAEPHQIPASLKKEKKRIILKQNLINSHLNKGEVIEKFHCTNHNDSLSVGSCLICEEVFCEDCLVDHESMHFCKEHFRVYAGHKWKQITDVCTTPETPEDGLYIYKFKQNLWVNTKTPSFVLTHYKINIENDFIESFIQLNVREEDVEFLSLELSKELLKN